ncbi:hypothetical protein KCU73_g72, partial [Aureobasidium melanogenum]
MLTRPTCAPIKNISSSPNPLTMDTLAYKRNDSATDVMGMKAKAAFLRASDDFPIAATAPGSMNIRSDIQNSGSSKAWRAGFMLRCFRSGSLPYDGSLCTNVLSDIVRQTRRLVANGLPLLNKNIPALDRDSWYHQENEEVHMAKVKYNEHGTSRTSYSRDRSWHRAHGKDHLEA